MALLEAIFTPPHSPFTRLNTHTPTPTQHEKLPHKPTHSALQSGLTRYLQPVSKPHAQRWSNHHKSYQQSKYTGEQLDSVNKTLCARKERTCTTHHDSCETLAGRELT